MRRTVRFLKALINFAFAVFIMLAVYFFVPDIKNLGFSGEDAARQKTGNKYGYGADADGRNSAGNAAGQQKAESAADGYEAGAAEDMHGSGEITGYFITSEDIAAIGDLSLGDKLTAMAVLSKLGDENIERLYRLIAQGITEDELREIRQILEKKLSRDDIGVLLDILNRNKKTQADGQPVP